METWFLVLGWFLSILTTVVNGFVILLVCRKRQLRTKTTVFVASLAVADFGGGMFAAPSRLLCNMVNECISDKKSRLHVMRVWVFFICASGAKLASLVLERYMAVVKPLKHLTFMKRRRVIQMVFTCWGIPFIFTIANVLSSIRLDSFYSAMTIVSYLYLLFEVILCVILIFCLASMFLNVYKQNSRDRKTLQTLVQTQNKSAVKWGVLVTCVFLLCYAILLRCSLLYLTGNRCGNDLYYKVPVQVINSGINPIVYAFFKRDIKQECGRLLFKRRR